MTLPQDIRFVADTPAPLTDNGTGCCLDQASQVGQVVDLPFPSRST